MERIPETKALSGKFPAVAHALTCISSDSEDGAFSDGDSEDWDSPTPVITWKGKNTLQPRDELMPDVATFKGTGKYFEGGGSSSFYGAIHPPEPVDSDLMRPLYLPISENKPEGKCLVKSLSMNGPFLQDLSIHVSIPSDRAWLKKRMI